MTYEIVITPQEGSYRAICPQLPGLLAQAATPGAALDAASALLDERLARRGGAATTVVEVRATLRDTTRRA